MPISRARLGGNLRSRTKHLRILTEDGPAVILPPEALRLLEAFASHFTRPSFRRFVVLLVRPFGEVRVATGVTSSDHFPDEADRPVRENTSCPGRVSSTCVGAPSSMTSA